MDKVVLEELNEAMQNANKLKTENVELSSELAKKDREIAELKNVLAGIGEVLSNLPTDVIGAMITTARVDVAAGIYSNLKPEVAKQVKENATLTNAAQFETGIEDTEVKNNRGMFK